jgi:hypothetical protein
MTCTKCKHEFCWLCLARWSDHPKTFYKCEQYKKEDDPYLKPADNINRHFLGKYHDEFNRRKPLGRCIVEKMEVLTNILVKLAFSYDSRNSIGTGLTHDQVKDIVRRFLDQLYWANENVRWAQVHLFCARFEQVQHLPLEKQISLSHPPLTFHQKVFEMALNDLKTVTDKWIAVVSASELRTKPDFAIDNLVKVTKSIMLYRDTILKHCDPHYDLYV